ncbi:exodeoxyribonuclease VII large subunit [Amphritea sp. 1_MG-2023]|uniref:exodeoxyribonuclease VII large subunit n=1 Tax=Amphritea sp. 1_MG-2023 TaxID=3062670 RepID=UPI0026E422F7|nr:exodeoxyribonuclease VII large subunit [Amphritea sp. 1_MG-2023]MDO6562819.1 exodeoxyribonuclease VII large subunit [Amphritea sp. 1_MG-2023]
MQPYSAQNRSRNSAATTALSVTELNRQVKSLLESSFLTIHVEGELSNVVKASSGHWYFTLKDRDAQVRCAMFRNRNQYLKYKAKNGDKVVVRAKVSLYPGRGDYQLICDYMEESGVGSLQQAYEALKQKLQQQGLFDPAFKKPIPAHPQHLGIITSPTGAAVHDILTVLKRRFPSLPITLFPTTVQGADAAAQIADAIRLANHDGRCDVLIVGRGGGSLEDLWPFNEEIVAHSIFHSEIPIISAVGHEVDVSIADFVADLRAATPSAAAELISPDQQQLLRQLQQLQQRLTQAWMRSLQQRQQQLQWTRTRLRHPGDKLKEQAQKLDDLELRMQRAIRLQLERQKQQFNQWQQRYQRCSPLPHIAAGQQRKDELQHRLTTLMQGLLKQHKLQLSGLAATLNSVSPLATLDRGYAIVQDENGSVIQDIDHIVKDRSVETRLSNGRFRSTVTQIIKQ